MVVVPLDDSDDDSQNPHDQNMVETHTQKPLTATFTADTSTTSSISASNGKQTITGSCSIKATCSIKLKTRGTWSVLITPKKNGSLGVPAKKTFKV